MHIFIDESGIFSNPMGKKHKVSCISSLVIPEDFYGEIVDRFEGILSGWRKEGSEIKGSSLDENQISEVIGFLSEYPVILISCAIDMGLHTDSQIELHKNGQANKFVHNINPAEHPNVKRQIYELKENTQKLSNQLYVQMQVLTEVIHYTIQNATLYYCQRIPETLSCFNWIIDAKDAKITEFEKLWSFTILPFLQDKSLNEPFITITEGDYSYFDKKFANPLSPTPDHLKMHIKNTPDLIDSTDVKKIMENLSFNDSVSSCGLQLVDILASAISRAFNGNLQHKGWEGIGGLMVQTPRKKSTMQFIVLHHNSFPIPPYANVQAQMDNYAKQMFLN